MSKRPETSSQNGWRMRLTSNLKPELFVKLDKEMWVGFKLDLHQYNSRGFL